MSYAVYLPPRDKATFQYNIQLAPCHLERIARVAGG